MIASSGRVELDHATDAMPSTEAALSKETGPTRYAWYVVAMLMLVSVLGYVDRLVLSLLVQPIKAELHLTDTQVGMVTGLAFALLYVIGGVPIGRMIDRHNRSLVLAACVLIWSIATAGGGLATSFAFLFLARIGVGVGEASVSPAAVSLIGDLFPSHQVQKPLSLYSIGLYAGGGLALILGAEVVAYVTSLGPITLPHFGAVSAWRVTFLSLGVPGIIVALMLLFTVKDRQRRKVAAATQTEGSVGAIAYARSHLRLLILLVATVVLWGMNGYGFLNWYPAMLTRTYAMTPQMVAHTYGVAFLICGTVGSLALTPLARVIDRDGRNCGVFTISIAALALLALCSAIGPLMPGRMGVIVFSALSIFCQSLTVVSVYAIITYVAPPALRGAFTGAYMSIMNITGGAFGAVLVGLLADHVFGAAGLNRALCSVALVFGPASSALMWLARREYQCTLGARSE